MRIVRIIAVIAAAVIALAVVGAILLLVSVDPNHYRGDVERIAQQQTGRELTINGKLELKVFPWLALSIHDVRLGNPKGFESAGPALPPFLSVHDLSIGVKLLPLLAKRLEVSHITLNRVTANLVSRGDENNWQGLGRSETPAPEGTQSAGTSSPETLSIEGVDVIQSAVLLRDELKKTTTELSNLELHSGRLYSSPGRSVLQDVVLQGAWQVVPFGAAPSTPQVQSPGPLPFSVRVLQIAFDAGSQTLEPARIEAKVAGAAMLISLAGERMASDRIVTGNVAITSTSARKLLESLGASPPLTRDPQALSAFALQANFRLTPKQLQLTGLQLTLDDTRAQGRAAVDDLDSSAVSFDLNVNGINLDRYRAPIERAVTPPKGEARPSPEPAKIPTPLPLETLRKLDVHGTLRVGSAKFAGLVFTDATMPLVAEDGNVRLGPTGARLYGGTYNGDIVLDARAVQAQLSLNEHVQDTDIGALLEAAYDTDRIVGRADVNVAVTGVGNTDVAMMGSLTGKIDANVKQGALNGIDVTYELQRAGALLKGETLPQRRGPERTVFNSLQASATLDKGVLRNDELRIETDFLKVHGGGTVDLATDELDYRLTASVYKLPPGEARGAGTGLEAFRALDVPLLITGTLASPTVRPDIEALAKGRLRQEVQTKIGDQVRKKLGDKLKDLLGH